MLDREVNPEVEALKKQIKGLGARAIQHKMELHDLAEDLPLGWERIREVAEDAYEAYRVLALARAQLTTKSDPCG